MLETTTGKHLAHAIYYSHKGFCESQVQTLDIRGLPSAHIAIEAASQIKHGTQVNNTACVPMTQVLVEGACSIEHGIEGGGRGGAPVIKGLIE